MDDVVLVQRLQCFQNIYSNPLDFLLSEGNIHLSVIIDDLFKAHFTVFHHHEQPAILDPRVVVTHNVAALDV